MRELSLAECSLVAGAGNNLPAFTQKSDSNGNTILTTAMNGVIIETICPSQAVIGFNLGVNGAGKIVDFNTGLSWAVPSNCRTETTNTNTGTKSICSDSFFFGYSCTTYDKDGHKVSEVGIDRDDTGLVQLASTEGLDLNTYTDVDYDWDTYDWDNYDWGDDDDSEGA